MLGLDKLSDIHGLIILTTGFISLSIHFVVMFLYYKKNTFKVIKDYLESDFETRIVNEEQKKSGFISYDETGKIFYITEHLARNDFKKYLGKNIYTLLDPNEGLEVIKSVNNNSYKFINNVSSRIVHVIDNSNISRLERIIEEKQHAVFVIKLDYSDRIKYNAIAYSRLSAKVSEIVHSFSALIDGTFSFSQTGEEIIIVSE
jgi:c-di-AMP phosphodiesterase-like protein